MTSGPHTPYHPSIASKAKNIKLLVTDVDGVMTRGELLYFDDGREAKIFNVRDGLGVKLWLASGGNMALLSGRESKAVMMRALELGIRIVKQGVSDKLKAFEEILLQAHCKAEDVLYVGDDLPDLDVFKVTGLSAAVNDACPEMKSRADFILKSKGGEGAIREVCELLLKSRGAWKV